MLSPSSTRSFLADSSTDPADLGADARRISPVWSGILHEFRNHLTVLMAATSELREEIPAALALRVGDALSETERNVQGLTSLVALVDASLRTADSLIAPLGDVIEKAVRLAAPATGRRASITTEAPRDVGVRNRGSALECLIATLILDLARAAHAQPKQPNNDIESNRLPCVRVVAEAGRRGIFIDVASPGARLDPASWRLVLATELAAKLDATLTTSPEASAYLVQLR
jgi:hypothetical protein